MGSVALPRVVPRRTLESIISNFTTTLKQLDTFIDQQQAETLKAESDIAAATERKASAAAGIERARGVRARIAEIIG
jgi:aromatic ring hydroxylase